ncbi:GDSL family lipase [Pigmentiphaga sp. NML080357]|uniref:SGNH/GDSL hydrolase family protein n=1 Tax=Pigmentiphaga sp. NML080357 TaxID=2008675 RepID=UPI000B419534|nr:SGNH/GDSL hydrolase family protein [Pigmentiphaga sp. NML080357]OVZ57786.1 GDSL family lipase [Pigmentiphaga sp. NML080357]
MKPRHAVFAMLLAMGSACPPVLAAQETAAGTEAADSQWAASFAAFDRADRLHAPPMGGVLFVGSSSIRMWDDLETRFKPLRVLKRGFGGSRMIDCTRHLGRLVTRYRPRVVLVYAGDNDLAEGRSPRDILESFAAFVEGVRRELPDTRIAYISIKPSPARFSLISRARAANALVEAYARTVPATDYIDVFTPMLTADGLPRAELFREDALHLNQAGYALWTSVISAYLR